MHCPRPLKTHQRGLSMIGFLFVALVLVMLAAFWVHYGVGKAGTN